MPVHAVDLEGLLQQVAELIQRGTPSTVAYVNAHVMEVARVDPLLADFLRGVELCYADGLGVVLAARLLGEHLPGRLTGADWIDDLAARACVSGWRLAWIGGQPGVTEEAARRLTARHPGLEVVLTDHGYHAVLDLDRLNDARPDLVLVGMGTPAQEHWVRGNRDHIQAPVVWCLGATADFVSGRVERGPRWLHQRQEWLARLTVEPGRLWRRYLLGNPRFLARVLQERALRSLRG